jgi:hypothetical protein
VGFQGVVGKSKEDLNGPAPGIRACAYDANGSTHLNAFGGGYVLVLNERKAPDLAGGPDHTPTRDPRQPLISVFDSVILVNVISVIRPSLSGFGLGLLPLALLPPCPFGSHFLGSSYPQNSYCLVGRLNVNHMLLEGRARVKLQRLDRVGKTVCSGW